MLKRLRAIVGRLITPVAQLLLRLGISPDAVTILGTIGAVTAALVFFPQGRLVAGAATVGALVILDVLDGTMARISGRTSVWGGFLDSTLDRVADAAVFVGLTIHLARTGQDSGAIAALACLALGAIVPYARAKAESLGMHATVGIAERGDRLLVTLVAAGLVGFGLHPQVLVIVLWVLAAASVVTIVQRMLTVRSQARSLDAKRAEA